MNMADIQDDGIVEVNNLSTHGVQHDFMYLTQ